jgi:hypothetical protein
MMNSLKAQKARALLVDAKHAVENELNAARQGNTAVDSVDNLEWAMQGIQDMIDSIDRGELIDPPGISYVAGDQWDYRSKAQTAVIEAEYAYKKLI